MKSIGSPRHPTRLPRTVRYFPRLDAIARMVADVISVNMSLLLAFLVCYFWQAGSLQTPRLDALTRHPWEFITGYAVFWSSLALVVFHCHGFYTRTRGYAHRYKVTVVMRAITVLVVGAVLLDALLYQRRLLPLSVAVTAWMWLLVTVGGSRLLKYLFLERYRVEPKFPPSKPDRVLVVGGAGYLGSVLVPMLLDHGYRVRVLDSLLFGKEPLKAVGKHANFELIPGDVRDIQAVVQTMKGVDAVIDLAAIVGDPACEENPQLAAEINRAATRMMIDIGRGYGIQRFLLASTCSVYGASEFLMDEHSQVAPISLYARTKMDSENLLLAAQCVDFHPTILRLSTLFGVSPRPRFDLVVNLLTARAIRSRRITIYNGEQWRPFMDVYDAARCFLACLEVGNLDVVSGEIFNAGSFELNHRLSEVAEIISNAIPAVEVERVDNQDRRNYRVSFDKIHSRLGFVCERTLEQGIHEIADMVRRSEVKDFSSEMFNNRAMVHLYAQSAEASQSSIRRLESLARSE